MSSEALQPSLDIIEILNNDREFQLKDGDEYEIHPNRVARIETCGVGYRDGGGNYDILHLKTLSIYPDEVQELSNADATWILRTSNSDRGRLVGAKRYNPDVDTAKTIYQFINCEKPSYEVDDELVQVLQQVRAQYELDLDLYRRRHALGGHAVKIVMGLNERLDDFMRQALKYKIVRNLLRIIH
jgi:hypothetical protein